MTHTGVSAHDRKNYRRLLLDMNRRLTGRVTQLEAEALRPAAEHPAPTPPAHEADPGTREAEEELARTLLASEEQLLEEVNAALARLDEGTFGQCEVCGKQITHARLDVMPYARTCVRCARDAEQTGG